MQGIGIGTSDFKNLRVKQKYFVDKSLYIKKIIDDPAKVAFVTRPRRFGKTLNMSMLRYYFDCTQKDSKQLFEGLKIMEQEEKYTSKLGYYPCIYMTLKDVQGTTYENMILDLKTAVLDIYQQHRYLLDSDKIYDFEKKRIEDILFCREDEVALKNSVKDLSEYLNRYYGKTVMLLIDEYDVPLQKVYEDGYYRKVLEFFGTFYGVTCKDNSYLEKTVVTGISGIAKESVISRSK